MKRLIVVLLACVLLTACAAPPSKVEDKNSSLEAAKQILVETKEKMSETVKPEYFESDEWKAFVDGYWNDYNKGQERMKNPEYKDMTDIRY